MAALTQTLGIKRHVPALEGGGLDGLLKIACLFSAQLGQIGYTLACSAITKDADFIKQLEAYSHIERLNIGPVSTMAISWDQPHEGNMFEFLWQRRSIERAW
jgi:hypothetical protein